ncbi:hypothetical protein NMY22_g16820 [Coprinellus aureogranulatus]|nr:hypothetical protein NMY22_g16820 [Coprinellus aureogranulatus]
MFRSNPTSSNLSRRRSMTPAHGYSTPARPSPSGMLTSTPQSFVRTSQQSQSSQSSPLAPFERPKPTYASRFLSSLLAGDKVAKSKSPIPGRTDNHGGAFSVQIPGGTPFSPPTSLASQIHNANPRALQDQLPSQIELSAPDNDGVKSQLEGPPYEAAPRASAISSFSTLRPTVPDFPAIPSTPATVQSGSTPANPTVSTENPPALTTGPSGPGSPPISAVIPHAPTVGSSASASPSGSLISPSGSSAIPPPKSLSTTLEGIEKPNEGDGGQIEGEEGQLPQPNPTPTVACRRSTRVSKSAQTQNEKVTKPAQPGWFIITMDYLESLELGEDWEKLVVKWASLEASMGYGQPSRGPISASGRPDEWTKWINKTWQGLRRYDKFPSIEEPAEIGIKMCRWWKSLQPSFRGSKTPFPRQVYRPRAPADGQDAWANLRKPGPNGFISVLMLMSWWGTALADASEWVEDSRPLWKALLIDITHVVDAMSGLTSDLPDNKAVKRPSDKENAVPVTSKRRRK